MAVGDLVTIKWVDTVSASRWADHKFTADDLRPTLCESHGVIIAETKDYVTLSSTLDRKNENVSSSECFPRSAIKSITKLREARR